MTSFSAFLASSALLSAGFLQAPSTAATSGSVPPGSPPKVSLYVAGTPLDYAALLPQPPAAGSAAAVADLRAVHTAEATRTPTQVRSAQQDDHEESMFAFASVLGPRFTPSELPLTASLSEHLRAESSVINPALKVAFRRPRPFVTDSTLHPVCDRAATNSYPSGHAMVGYLEAFALAQMVPERSEAILQRAHDFAGNRVLCGVHYPSDIEASHTIALALFGTLSTSPRFQSELASAKAELRKHLGLPAR